MAHPAPTAPLADAPTATVAPHPRWAVLVTDVLAPGHAVAALVLATALYASPGVSGLGHVALAVLLCGGLPYLFVHGLARARVLESRHVRPRAQRMVVFAGLVLIEVAAIIVLHLTGAAPLLSQLLTAYLAGVVALALVTPVVRASVHTGVFSVAAGVATSLSWWLATGLAVVAVVVGLARLAVFEHTRTEVVTGLVLGAVVGAGAAALLVG
ncbi:hypothetical protein EQW78_10360 [Oerskovia turbata]|uniref:Phosphatase PAP2 family protein n=1 Tax=Oerskovia turbata TaxID=1713 RepID=A0A4Q1KVA0_9CELL|nr:hypothetical protein [Oerskovia turbata]RXR23825.1 hypothetical protein EQW73_14540 [Oerskovia turbata]RXR33705.1 hypothetical protein EQW78_10360 [Oerskovia turbata]TGJ96879.1 hypothetical protein DLJ96_02120 [Actinotalea fermentans ATCC 43279 = JCM 9966 = DSM 3133]